MSAPEKLSWFFGYQLFVVAFIVAAFWLLRRVTAFTSNIPPDLLVEHRNRMKWGFMILIPLCVATNLLNDFLPSAPALHSVGDALCALVFVNYVVRSGLTISSKKTPGKLKQLAWLEMFLSFFAALMFALIAVSAWSRAA